MVSVTVMAHPKRTAMARRLAEKLNCGIVWDRGGGIWDTARRALEQTAGEWHMVVQDDAVPSQHLVEGVEQAIACLPAGGLFAAYTPGHQHIDYPTDWAALDSGSFIRLPVLIGGVATAYPSRIIPTLIEACESSGVASYDRRVFDWTQTMGIPVFYPSRSLVDHADGKSLRGGRRGRRAWRFIGADQSALEMDWNLGVVDG